MRRTTNIERLRSRGGFTLIELIFSITLVAIVLGQATYVMRSVSKSAQDDTTGAVLEDQVQAALDRIAYAIMGSNRATLVPKAEGDHFTDLKYKVSLGFEDGAAVWADPEQIALDADDEEVVWSENPGAAEERSVVWTKYVSPLMEGEIFNGDDDNGNGLIDEEGLSFVIDGNAVTVRVTLRRLDRHGNPVSVNRETTVTCRNLMPETLSKNKGTSTSTASPSMGGSLGL